MDLYLKNIRNLSYSLNIWDDVNLPYVENYINIARQVIEFFKTESKLVYPAKSFFVAIVYAKCFERWFNEDFKLMLNDKDLLPDDKFYVPYAAASSIYDEVLNQIEDIWRYKSIDKTVDYFKKEFLIID